MTQAPSQLGGLSAEPPIQPRPGPADDWQNKAQLFDYRQAANPVRPGLTEPIGYQQWGPALHQSGPTAIIPLDLSAELGCGGPATSPALAAHFLRIEAGDSLTAAAAATSSLFYVLAGSGELQWQGRQLNWGRGDVFVLPAGGPPLLRAEGTCVLYWVHDAPLLRYLGVSPAGPRFSPCYFSADQLDRELSRLLADPTAIRSNRLSVLLAHGDLAATRTISHTLWAMVGEVPPGAIQAPHRHQSVAIDLITDCDPGCYSLVGTELDGHGRIRNPRRIEWEAGGVFITPPGHWHSHVNTSGRAARLLPIQDAGLHTYLRSLDIRFAGGVAGQD